MSLLLQLDAGNTTQFLHRALGHHAIAALQRLRAGGDQVGHSLDALCLQLGRQSPANAPYLIHWGDRHQPSAPSFIPQLHHAALGGQLLAA